MATKKTTKKKTIKKAVKHKETAQHKEVFYTWYELDRNVAKVCQKLPISDRTLRSWIERFKWDERADELDKRVNEKAERKLVNDKAKRQADMLKNHYQVGNMLLAASSNYFQKNQVKLKDKDVIAVENGHQAIRAAEVAIKIQRQAEGLPDFLIDLLDKSNDELRQELYELAHDESEAAENGSDSEDS